MIAAFLSKNWLSLLVVVGILAAASAIYLKGHSDGKGDAERDAREAVFNQLKERNVTDEQVGRMSDPDLCRAIGGKLQQDGRCL